jgi:hypothetical protein
MTNQCYTARQACVGLRPVARITYEVHMLGCITLYHERKAHLRAAWATAQVTHLVAER